MDLEKIFRLAVELHRQGSLLEAEELYRQLIVAAPQNSAALHMLGLLRFQQNEHETALALLEQALDRDPKHANAIYLKGLVFRQLGNHQAALESFDRFLAVVPTHVEVQYNRGDVLWLLRRFEEALASYDAVLALRPAFAAAHCSRGLTLLQLRRFDHALKSFDRALKLAPDLAEAWTGRGNVLWETNQPLPALESFDRAISIKPNLPEALNSRANSLQMLKRYGEAISDYEKVIQAAPGHAYAPGGLAMAALCLCDWERVETIGGKLPQLVSDTIFPPFTALAYSDDSKLLRQCAERNVRNLVPIPPAPLWRGEHYAHEKIRIAYLSSNFCQHPITAQLVGLLERHVRAEFEIIAVSCGADDQSRQRLRVMNASDQFLDLRMEDSRAIAEKLRAMEIDILVDLAGHTDRMPLEVLSYRPAPVQATWLGCAGTTGADFVDYIIADRIVIPEVDAKFFSEKIAYLPDTFFPVDTERMIRTAMSRSDVGLPDNAFVFCCFNNSWKVTERIFSIWMNLLRRVPSSVLWLKSDAAEVVEGLKIAARNHGVESERLIFAGRIESDADHLGRQGLADLFLDTLPYSAHATGCDALWAGLPIVTCRGRSFAGRVTASLLSALGLPELVADNLDEYEAIAMTLAQEPDAMRELRRKLNQNRSSQPLFNADRFRDAIEAAFRHMHLLASKGTKPGSFDIKL